MHDVQLLDAVAKATESQGTLPELVAPLLELLAEISGLETTFLTSVDVDANVQELEQVHRADGSDASGLVGMQIPWDMTLCKECLDRGIEWIEDIPAILPDNIGHTVAGWSSYVSVPIRLPGEDGVEGTLCGASSSTKAEDEQVERVFELFSRLIADHIARARAEQQATARAEHAETELAQRLDFMSIAEHALKNPLQLIGGWADVLIESGARLSDQQRADSLARIRGAAVRMRDQVEALLAESRAEAIAGEDRATKLELSEAIGTIATDWRTATAAIIDVEAPEPATVRADIRVLRIIMEHLIENAISIVGPGGTVVLRVLREDDEVVVHVDDDGPGLPEDVDVFAPFTRGSATTPRAGVGLGLYVVRRLVATQRGTVTGGSSPLGGARFTLRFPAV